MTDYDPFLGCDDCGIDDEWTRCERHASMMRAIWKFWHESHDNARLERIWDLSDGYGEPGFIPIQGYDWSGIRDSSVEAIEAMYEEATGPSTATRTTTPGP